MDGSITSHDRQLKDGAGEMRVESKQYPRKPKWTQLCFYIATIVIRVLSENIFLFILTNKKYYLLIASTTADQMIFV